MLKSKISQVLTRTLKINFNQSGNLINILLFQVSQVHKQKLALYNKSLSWKILRPSLSCRTEITILMGMVRKLRKILIDYKGFLSSDLLWRFEKYVFPLFPSSHFEHKEKEENTFNYLVRADSFSNRNLSGAN